MGQCEGISSQAPFRYPLRRMLFAGNLGSELLVAWSAIGPETVEPIQACDQLVLPSAWHLAVRSSCVCEGAVTIDDEELRWNPVSPCRLLFV